MATLYGSCPLEQAADQTRSGCGGRRASRSVGQHRVATAP